MRPRRFFCTTLLMTFILSNILIPSMASGINPEADFFAQKGRKIRIPENLGKVEKVYEADSKERIILVRDAHVSLEAQEKMAELIRILVNDGGIHLVCEEGMEGPIDTQYVYWWPDEDLKREVAHKFLEEMRIGGAEYAHILNGGKFELFGAEDSEVYAENLEAFREVLALYVDVDNRIRQIETEMEKIAKRILTPRLKKLRKLNSSYAAGRKNLIEYVEALVGLAEITDMNLLPHSAMLLNFAEKARKAKGKSREELEKIEEEFSKVKTGELFKEVEALKAVAYEKLYTDPEQIEFVKLSENLRLIKSLRQAKLVRAGFDRIQSNIEDFRQKRFWAFIESHGGRALKNVNPILDIYLEKPLKFYRLALKRDRILVEMTLGRMKERGRDEAVLVAGGFHSSGIEDILKENGISHVVIAPSFADISVEREGKYLERIKGKLLPFEQLILEMPLSAVRERGNFAIFTPGQHRARANLAALDVLGRRAYGISKLQVVNDLRSLGFKTGLMPASLVGREFEVTEANSLGDVPVADRIRFLRNNLDPRWNPAAKRLLKELEKAGEDVFRANTELMERLSGIETNLREYIEDKDTWLEKESGYWETLKGKWVVFNSAEYILSGVRIREDIDVDKELEGKGVDLNDSKEVLSAVAELVELMIEGERVSNFNGGLGVLSGDEVRGQSDLGWRASLSPEEGRNHPNFLSFGLFYHEGCFINKISPGGRQTVEFEPLVAEKLPIEELVYPEDHPKAGQRVVVELPMPGGEKLFAGAKVVNVGRVKVILLDTDIPENTDFTFANITKTVYPGQTTSEVRFRQQYVLGMGSFEIMKKLGIPPDVAHVNEGFAAFIIPAMIKYYMDVEKFSFNEAWSIVREKTVFTTHTLVAAEDAKFDPQMITRYLAPYFGSEEPVNKMLRVMESFGGFSPSRFAMKSSGDRNAVSELNASEATAKFGIPFKAVTNGVHRLFWQDRKIQEWLAGGLDKILNPRLKTHRDLWLALNGEEELPWTGKEESPLSDKEIWDNHRDKKRRMIWIVREYMRRSLEEQIGTLEEREKTISADLANGIEEWQRENLGRTLEWTRKRKEVLKARLGNLTGLLSEGKFIATWARRFAGYKRAALIMLGEKISRLEGLYNTKDANRLLEELIEEGAFQRFLGLVSSGAQFIFAGKAHPDDANANATFYFINRAIERLGLENQVVLVPGYDERLAMALEQGSDIWFASSIIPLEASGTSGMKAGQSGCVPVGTRDGWLIEGVKNGVSGFFFGLPEAPPAKEKQKQREKYFFKEAEDMYRLFHQRMLPVFYGMDADGVPRKWVNVMRAAIYQCSKYFDMDRVEKQYSEMYADAVIRSEAKEWKLKARHLHFRRPITIIPEENGEDGIIRINVRREVDLNGLDFTTADWYFWFRAPDGEWTAVKADVALEKGKKRVLMMTTVEIEGEGKCKLTSFAVKKDLLDLTRPVKDWDSLVKWAGMPGEDHTFPVGNSLGEEAEKDVGIVILDLTEAKENARKTADALTRQNVDVTVYFRKNTLPETAEEARLLFETLSTIVTRGSVRVSVMFGTDVRAAPLKNLKEKFNGWLDSNFETDVANRVKRTVTFTNFRPRDLTRYNLRGFGRDVLFVGTGAEIEEARRLGLESDEWVVTDEAYNGRIPAESEKLAPIKLLAEGVAYLLGTDETTLRKDEDENILRGDAETFRLAAVTAWLTALNEANVRLASAA